MISHDKIDEWIAEVEQRPTSASNIIRYIARRLSELTNRNEELLNENIALRLEKKVDEYESRIASLEYQLEILKRQISSGAAVEAVLESSASVTSTISVLVYNGLGHVLRFEIEKPDRTETGALPKFSTPLVEESFTPRLLVTNSQEELLFVFDSGRAVTAPVVAIPISGEDGLSWDQAYVQEPRGSEELATILPIGKMTLAELCIQTSRRGFVKKMSESFFESCVTNSFVGTGTKQKQDKTCSLLFCKKDDLFVMVSKEGRSFTMEANKLPLTIEPSFQIGPTDHIVATFTTSKKPYILFVTDNGKAVYRDIQWLEQANSFRTQGQPIFSKARRDSGTWIVGAAAVEEKDWAAALTSSGVLRIFQVRDLFENGSLGISDIVDFEVYGS